MIPAQYDHPYHGKVVIYYAYPKDIRRICGAPARGCALMAKKICYVVINSGYMNIPAWVKEITRHEVAHCNGWSPRHD